MTRQFCSASRSEERACLLHVSEERRRRWTKVASQNSLLNNVTNYKLIAGLMNQ